MHMYVFRAGLHTQGFLRLLGIGSGYPYHPSVGWVLGIPFGYYTHWKFRGYWVLGICTHYTGTNSHTQKRESSGTTNPPTQTTNTKSTSPQTASLFEPMVAVIPTTGSVPLIRIFLSCTRASQGRLTLQNEPSLFASN